VCFAKVTPPPRAQFCRAPFHVTFHFARFSRAVHTLFARCVYTVLISGTVYTPGRLPEPRAFCNVTVTGL
jgi:hypothetical protein